MTSTIEDAIISNCKITGNCTIDNYLIQQPISTVCTTSNILEYAGEIVRNGLQMLSKQELAKIFYDNLIYDLLSDQDKENAENLLRINKNDYAAIIQSLMSRK